MSDQPLHIAFMNMGGSDWPAGTYYLRNLFSALRSLPTSARPRVSLLVAPRTAPEKSLEPFIDQVLEIPPEPSSNRLRHAVLRFLPGALSRSLRPILMPRPVLCRILKEQGAQVLFSQVGKINPKLTFELPLLVWIYDFQHRRISKMFSEQEIALRDSQFGDAASYANRVILSSHDALADALRYFPAMVEKARVLSFVSVPPVDVYEHDPLPVLRQYHLPERFVYLPNQFWKHKNHKTVIAALRLACQQDPNVTVVCSGGMQDYRDAGYLPSLFTSLAEHNLRERFIVLGVIPHDHLFQLMRQSLAVLQPSDFEGWNTTVEEVKSLGKSIIISDLPVHHEQNAPTACYFDPHDPEALAVALLRTFAEGKPGPDIELETEARRVLPERIARFARTFVDIVREVV